MPTALVSLGANLGNSRASIHAAANMLLDHFGSDQVRFSSLLTSPAVGGPQGRDDFFNAVACIDTHEGLFDFWHNLREIESQLGRERRQRWESRRIDLDILMFDHQRLWTPHLKIPHPRMVTRSFAILPAAELAPEAIEPVSGCSLESLARRLNYLYDPPHQRLQFLEPLDTSKNEVLVLCIGEDLQQAMAQQWNHRASPFEVRFLCYDKPTTSFELESMVSNQLSQKTVLLVLAVECPDPMIVAWEDYSRWYARWLGFDPNPLPEFTNKSEGKLADQPLSFQVPKYLLNCADLVWATHELNAALVAMHCELAFANPGWTLSE